MDDDQLTRQRAMDAAAAVAVAAAAAAHQSQEAAAQRQQEQLLEQQNDEFPHHQQPVEDAFRRMDENNGAVQHENEYPATTTTNLEHGLKEEVTDSVRKVEDEKEDFADSSMQFADESQDQNGNMSLEDGQGTNARPHVHHTKRRKINTCLPCKRRKVKCDREKPYCGECRKHNFPASECTWSAAIIERSPARGAGVQLSAPNFATSSAIAEPTSAGSNSGSQWYEMPGAPWANFPTMPLDQNSNNLMGRIAELEAALAASTKGDESNSDVREANGHWDSSRGGLSEAAHGMAADALAMIAQHQPSANQSSPFFMNNNTFYKAKRLLPTSRNDNNGSLQNSSIAGLLPMEGPVASGRIRELLALLPDQSTIRKLINDFEAMQDHGLDLGVALNLIKLQCTKMEEAISKSSEEEFPILDLSFITLLFFLLTVTLEFKDVSDVLLNMGLTEKEASYNYMTGSQRQEAVHEVTDLWYNAGQSLLSAIDYEDNPNLNIIFALSLQRHYLRARGRTTKASTTLAKALTLCNVIGLDRLGGMSSTSWLTKLEIVPDAKDPLADGYFMYPIFGPTMDDRGEAKVSFWLPNGSSMVLESARRLFCHILVQVVLEEPFTIKMADSCMSEKDPLRIIEPTEIDDNKGPYESNEGIDGVVSSVRVSHAFSELANTVSEAREEIRQRNPIDDVDEESHFDSFLEDLLNTEVPPKSAAEVGEGNSVDEGRSMANSYQRTMVKLYMKYHRLAGIRRISTKDDRFMQTLNKLYDRRIQLQNYSTQYYTVTKILGVQQITLELALMLSFRLCWEKKREVKSEIRKKLEVVVPLLVLGTGEEQSRAQKLMTTILANNLEGGGGPTKSIDITTLQQQTGFRKGHTILTLLGKYLIANPIETLGPEDQLDEEFWMLIHKNSTFLLSTSST